MTARPVALLHMAALQAAGAPAWAESAQYLTRRPGGPGEPLLHGQTLPVSQSAVRALLAGVAYAARQAGVRGSDRWPEVLVGTWRRAPRLDGMRLVRASIVADQEDFASMAAATDLDVCVLATLGHLATLPLLLACGRRAAALGDIAWTSGFCPTCAAWPTLSERRGLDRQHWLRCGRCGSGWRFRHQQCPFCGNTDHRTLGYLAPEAERESRRAMVCQRCQGYLKTVTTMAALSPPEIVAQDLTTLELDVAALDDGWRRPERPGVALRLTLNPTR